ncbi:hypothetical protein D3C86_1342020 [compost metagenome]
MNAGGDAREVTVALEGRARHVDRQCHGIVERLEAAVVTAGFRQFEQTAFGVFDLRLRRHVERRVIGDVDDILADLDKRAAQRQIIDRPAVIFRVDDRYGFRCQTCEVLRHRQIADLVVGG